MSARWMLYSYDAFGLGHVRRATAIARAVLEHRADVSALLVTCSPLVDALPLPPGLDYIKLPSARKVDNHHYVPRTLRLEPEALHSLRSGLLRDSVRSFAPDLLLVDKLPEGLMGELRAAVRGRRDSGRGGRLVLGWRDILDEPEAVIDDFRDRGTLESFVRDYDALWVYGDPTVFDVRQEYRLPDRVAERMRYVGYLAPEFPEATRRAARRGFVPDDVPLALVTVGGGEDGERAIAAYLDACRLGAVPDGVQSLVVTGPCMPADAQQRLSRDAPAGVEVRAFVADLAPLVAAADVLVGMAGYNTSCEFLAGGTPAVLIPRVHPRREQWVRATRLAERGLCTCLDPDTLTPRQLGHAVRRELAAGRRTAGFPALDGLARVRREVESMLPATRTVGSSVSEVLP